MTARASFALAGLTALALACASCARCSSRGREETTIVRDPVTDADRHDDAAPPDVDRVLADARVVDVRKLALACALSPDLPVHEASDATRAYLLGKDSVLRVFDLGCSGEQWHATAPACDALVVAGDRIYCPTRTSITSWPIVTKSLRGSDVTADGKVLALGTSSPITQLFALDRRIFVVHASGALEVFEADTLSPFYSVKLPISGWYSKFVPLVKSKGACHVDSGKGFYLVCIDALGAIRLSKSIVIGKPTDPPFSSFYVRAQDDRYLLISSRWSSGPHRAVVVRLDDGVEVARVEDEIAAVVTRVEDGTIEGLIGVSPRLRLLELNGATRWSDSALTTWNESAVAIARGNRIFVASYPSISTGAMPLAFDRTTGKLLWTGDFEQLSLGHSAYSNEVALSLHATDDGDVLAVRGTEAGITYLQLFDLRDGKRRYSQTRYVY